MDKTIVEFSEQDVMRVEAIVMDADAAEALRFIKEVVKPKLRAKTAAALDPTKSTGIMT